jgi:hypothetical protein
MRWAHVVEIIGATELKSANVLRDPSLASTFYLSGAQNAYATRFLPHLKPAMRSELPSDRRAHIFGLNEGHRAPQSWSGRGEGRLISRAIEVSSSRRAITC